MARRRRERPSPPPRPDETAAKKPEGAAGNGGPESGTASAAQEPARARRQVPPGGPAASAGARRRWTVVDWLLAAALAASLAVLAVQVYRTYFAAGRGTSSRESGDLCARLRGRGDVLALGRNALPRCAVPGVRLVVPADLSPDGAIERLLSERDDAAVAEFLQGKGVKHVVVSTTVANPSLLPKVTVRNRLALYKPSDRFHALYLSEAAGLYEMVPGLLEVSDAEGAELVRVARAELTGTDHRPADLPGLRAEGEYDVAVELQGLTPVERRSQPGPKDTNLKPYVRHLRLNVVAGAHGRTLLEATREAARRLRAAYARRAQKADGPIAEAMPRLTVEIEVLYDWTDIHVATRGKERIPYRSFLWRAVDLGLHGIAVERGTPRFEFRLPSDAVYAGRKDVSDLLARVGEDLLADEDELERARRLLDNPNGTAADLAPDLCAADARLRVERFRTHHFREMTPGGSDIRRLSRSIPPVPMTPELVGRANLRDKIYWATRWLVENVQPDGRFRYRYTPEQDVYLSDKQIVEKYNEVRHGLATYSLFMSHQEIPSADLWDAAERSLRWILERVVFGPAWTADPGRRARLPSWLRTDQAFGPPKPDGGTAPGGSWRCPHGEVRAVPPEMAYVRHLDNAKMGAVAAAILAISEKIYQSPAELRGAMLEEYRPFLEGFADFLLFMQHPSGPWAGSFDHYFVSPEHDHYLGRNGKPYQTTIYPGEILFGLSRIYRLTRDPRIPPAFALAVQFERAYFDRESVIREPDGTYKNERRADLVQFVPWISMAMNDMHLAVREEDPARAAEYAEFGIRVSQWVAREYLFDEPRSFFPEYLGGYFKWEFELPAMHSMVYAEGTAAAFALGKRTGDPRTEEMRHATTLGCRFAVQQIVIPGLNDHFLPNPQRARGGVRFGINDSDMRTDYSYHTLSALNQTVRYMTDEELRP